MKQVALLQEYFGCQDFRRGQEEAVQHILQGHNSLVIMPTGAGKSLIYQYAGLVLHRRSSSAARGGAAITAAITLVISPLIALMKDQVDSLQANNITATYINSTLSLAEQQQRIEGMLQSRYSFVYIAPERLHQSTFIAALKNIAIQLLVIDEAHCISSWGHDFRPDYRRIAEVRLDLGKPLTVAVTATATSLVQDDIVGLLAMPKARRVVTGFNRPNLSFEVFYTTGDMAKRQELALLLQKHAQAAGSCIIYTATRREAEEVASFVGQNWCCAHYHAGMTAAQRARIQDAFSSGAMPIVVATNAFGMGIDCKNVRLVLHYNLPGTLEAYYQEAGRAGRDGEFSRAVLLYSPRDRVLQDFFIREKNVTFEQLHKLFQNLQRLPELGGSRLCDSAELCRTMKFSQQKLRLTLSHLEKAGMLQYASLPRPEERSWRLLLHDWNEHRANASMQQLAEYARHRKKQLEQMNNYAQAKSCRRQILLSYFSDPSAGSEVKAEHCCDYCSSQQLRQQKKKASRPNLLKDLSRSQRAALIILDSVRKLSQARRAVGRKRLAQILYGSQAQEMTATFRSQNYYGRLREVGKKSIETAIDELLQKGYLQYRNCRESLISVIDLAPNGSEAIEQFEVISLRAFSAAHTSAPAPVSVLVSGTSSTVEETLLFLQRGLSGKEVAAARGLSDQTISSHISNLLARGRLELDDYVTPAARQTVEKCLQKLWGNGSSLERLRPIKDMLPSNISYDELKFVLSVWKRPT